MTESHADTREEDRYFLFQLGSELYGTPLLGIREVIQAQEIKPVPNTVPHFLGVINIRGQVVGVIDLRVKFNHVPTQSAHNAMVVFDTSSGAVAAFVDRVDSVASIPQTAIDRQRNVATPISTEFLIGIGSIERRLATLFDLNRALGAEQIHTHEEHPAQNREEAFSQHAQA